MLPFAPARGAAPARPTPGTAAPGGVAGMSAGQLGNGLLHDAVEFCIADRRGIFSAVEWLRDADLDECVPRSHVGAPNVVMSPVEGRVTMAGADVYSIIADVGARHQLNCLGIAVVGPDNSMACLVSGFQRGEEGVDLARLEGPKHLNQVYLLTSDRPCE